jgi:glycosyltransferase involved in cell wall biosynthesis
VKKGADRDHPVRIIHLASGAGPMYCGSCLHSNTLVAGLRAVGVDAVLAPLYTPLRTDEENMSIGRLAFGGINVYLQDRLALFRRTPWFLDKLLDLPGLVRWAARRGSRTRPEQLGRLTISVLRGEDGRQRKEVEKLLCWLEDELRPDVMHLSNVLLAGLARPLRERLGVPVVATLSGEDSFLEKLPQPWYDEARAVLRDRAGDLTAMTAMNGYYADFMAQYLAVPRERISVIRPGLKLDGYGQRSRHTSCAGLSGTPTMQAWCPVPTTLPVQRIGFLSRICPEKGLHLLVEAAALLIKDGSLPPIRVVAAGYLDDADRPYLDDIQRRAAECGVGDRFEYLGELDRPAKIAFLQSLDLLCLPSLYPESKGLPALEAWAAGVPAVLPDHGAFPEMVEDTRGGVHFRPGDAADLASALRRMICDSEMAAQYGQRARAAVHERYTAARMAGEMLELYERVVG